MDFRLPPLHFSETRALQRSILYGSVRKTDFYLSRGCDPNAACGPHKMTPLMYACYVGDPKKRERIAEALLDRGARPGVADAFGRTALHYAVRLDRERLLARYLEGDDSNPARRDHGGNTILHLAALGNRPSMLHTILDSVRLQQVGTNALDGNGLTALDVASREGHEDCVVLLKREGCRSKPAAPQSSGSRTTGGSCLPRRGCHTGGEVIGALLKRRALSTLSSNRYTSSLQEPVTSEWVRNVNEYKLRPAADSPPRILKTRVSFNSSRHVPSPTTLSRQVTVHNIVTDQ